MTNWFCNVSGKLLTMRNGGNDWLCHFWCHHKELFGIWYFWWCHHFIWSSLCHLTLCVCVCVTDTDLYMWSVWLFNWCQHAYQQHTCCFIARNCFFFFFVSDSACAWGPQSGVGLLVIGGAPLVVLCGSVLGMGFLAVLMGCCIRIVWCSQ